MTTKTPGRQPASKKASSARKPANRKAAAPRPAAGSKAPTKPTMPTATDRSAAAPAPDSKQARLIASLRSKPGATIEQLMTLTGWQAHTVRGTISGVLRKRLGLNVTCAASEGDGARVYRIAAPAGA